MKNNKVGFIGGILGVLMADRNIAVQSDLDRIARMAAQHEPESILTTNETKKLPEVIIKSTKIKTIIPNGCKEYHFDNKGGFAYYLAGENQIKMKLVDIAFTCVALNNKRAINKFNKWKKENNI